MKVLPIHPWAIYPWDPSREEGQAEAGEEQEQEKEGRVQEIGIKRPGMLGSGQGGWSVLTGGCVKGEAGKAEPLAVFSSCLSCLCILFLIMSF